MTDKAVDSITGREGRPIACPRRRDLFSVSHRFPGGDVFTDSDHTCSYCGSLDPEVLLKRIEAGDAMVIPTDKTYKIYLRNDGGEDFLQTYRDCYANDGLGYSVAREPRCTGPKDCTHWVTRTTSQTKFYFQHLSSEQQLKFIELLNARRIKFSEPGYFYTKPYFIAYGNAPKEG
jgi:hypothetical protein